MKYFKIPTVCIAIAFIINVQIASAQTYGNVQVAHVNDCIKRTMSLNVFIAKDSIGRIAQSSSALKLNVDSVQMAVDSLNAHLAPICLQFKVCKITFVDNHKYYWFNDDRQPGNDGEREFFRNAYCEDSVINVLYVGAYFGSLQASNAAGWSDGSDDFQYLATPPAAKKKKPLVVVKGGGNPLWLGKYILKTMGLRATSGSSELVDGSNCELASAGDGICDTPADPQGAGEFPPTGPYPCTYSGTGQPFTTFPVDANGAVYSPMLGNLLGDHGIDCTAPSPKALTPGQYNKIIKLYYGDQSNIITSWKRYK
jgi:hypothetical protein